MMEIISHAFVLPFVFLSFLQVCSNQAAANSSCPINFNYVGTYPWDTTTCHQPVHTDCCQNLRGVLGMGLAQYLNETSMFYLPNVNTSASCLVDFRAKLESMSITGSVFSRCFTDPGEFANKPSSCAGIVKLDDWRRKVPANLALESSCKGDLTGLARCGICLEAGLQVNSHLVSLGPNSTKCFFFVILYAAGISNEFGPMDARSALCTLKVPLFTKESKTASRNYRVKLISGLVGGLSGICLTVFLFLVYRRWVKKKEQDMVHQNYVLSVKSKVLPNTGAKWFRVEELEQATNGFSAKNIIGRGGFGVVYKGTLSDCTEVAVKEVLDMDTKGDQDFTNEAEIISKIRHRNLLSLRGFCVTSERFQGKRRYLVYDYMSNGSLDDHLFVSGNANHHLSWPQRKNIILDIAKGLAYLHNGIEPKIYHRDIKATNILLDSDMRAKVADFGLAKQYVNGQSHVTTRVAGTQGYLAPEYAMYGRLTERTDVYSFGILILEIMSSTRVLDGSSKKLITDWAWELWKSGRVEEIFHKSMRDEGPQGVMERFVHVGLLCAHMMMAFRPTIADALRMLEGDIDIPRLPDRPLPLSHEVMETSFRYSSTSTASQGSRSRDHSSVSVHE